MPRAKSDSVLGALNNWIKWTDRNHLWVKLFLTTESWKSWGAVGWVLSIRLRTPASSASSR